MGVKGNTSKRRPKFVNVISYHTGLVDLLFLTFTIGFYRRYEGYNKLM